MGFNSGFKGLKAWALSRPVYSVESTLKYHKLYTFVDGWTYHLLLCVQIFPLPENTEISYIRILIKG